MNNINLYIDFGSIFTKVTAIDIEKKEVLGVAQAFTTTSTNVVEGMQNAINILKSKISDVNFNEIYACSSLENGLNVVVIGNVSYLSTNAAEQIALCAGVNVINAYSGKLTDEDIKEIEELDIDMIIISGGTDKGNKDCVIYNSKKLAKLDENISIIYAGNKEGLYDCRKILEKNFKDFRATDNVMPDYGAINVQPVKKAIKEAYVERLYKSEVFYKLQREITGIIMPTSYAIMNATSLLSKGTLDNEGLGDLMVVDCGGTFTNVYSVSSGDIKNEKILKKGVQELYEKRTYEPLGVRCNINNLYNINNIDDLLAEIKELDKSIDVEQYLEELHNNPRFLPSGQVQLQIDNLICKFILETSVDNHVGFYEYQGDFCYQYGKDLRNINTVIGVGGVIANSHNPKEILEGVLNKNEKSNKLKPESSQLYLYNQDIMYALGMLREESEAATMTILKKYLAKL